MTSPFHQHQGSSQVARSTFQSNILEGIAIGRSETSNATNIPLKTETGATEAESYMVLLDEGTPVLANLSELRMITETSSTAPSPEAAHITIPSFLGPNSKIILARDGLYHKGFLLHLPGGQFRFTVRHRLSSKREEWGVDLIIFASEWLTLCAENRLIPWHIVPTGVTPPPTDPDYIQGPSTSSVASCPAILSSWEIGYSIIYACCVYCPNHLTAHWVCLACLC